MRASVLLLLRDHETGESKAAGHWDHFDDNSEERGEEKAARFGQEWAAHDPSHRLYKIEVPPPDR